MRIPPLFFKQKSKPVKTGLLFCEYYALSTLPDFKHDVQT